MKKTITFHLFLLLLLPFAASFQGCRQDVIVHPERRKVIEAIYVTGRIIPSREVMIIAPGGGIIRKCRVRNGDRVENGQPLFLLGTLPNATSAGQPSAISPAMDPKLLASLKTLSPNMTIPPELLKSSTASQFTMRSPEAGKVFQILRTEGETVRPGDLMAIVGHPTERTIQLNVDQKDVLRIRAGQLVLIRDDLHPGVTFEGTVQTIYSMLNETNYTFRVDANIPAGYPDSNFIHMPVEGNIIIRQHDNALVIPREALYADDTVIVRKGNAKVKVFIRKGISTADDIEVTEGIDEGATIVIPAKMNMP
jgi:multidrug efflux pump subunit AcrA (membrane-fusion protein)